MIEIKTVMAQGTFDVLHPGHIHYLEKSAKLGGWLVVVVARDSRLEGRNIYFSEEERREMIQALEIVDEAVLGSEGYIYSTVEEVDPDVIALGYDQDHNLNEVRKMAEKASGHSVEVVRLDSKGDYSSSKIKS